MKLSEFKTHLQKHPDYELTFVLPDGDHIAAHAHITEVGRVDKRFMDCGGSIRRTATCLLQAWVADDTEHRLMPGKLAVVLDLAAPLFQEDDLDVEIEYEDCSISQFPVIKLNPAGKALVFQLGSKHTNCLAKDICLPQGAGGENRGGGCC